MSDAYLRYTIENHEITDMDGTHIGYVSPVGVVKVFEFSDVGTNTLSLIKQGVSVDDIIKLKNQELL